VCPAQDAKQTKSHFVASFGKSDRETEEQQIGNERQNPALVRCLFFLHQHPGGGNLAFLLTWCGVLPTDADNLMRNKADLHPWNEVLRAGGTRGVSEEKG
jgi:hypothetical protein